jgi:hypothetical protein
VAAQADKRLARKMPPAIRANGIANPDTRDDRFVLIVIPPAFP